MPKKRLTEAQMVERLKNAPRRKAGDVTFSCPHCDREMTRVLWTQPDEIDEYGNIIYDALTMANASCKCGAKILVAEVDYSGTLELYWLNKKEMNH
jgi:hypothetical protein